MLMVRSQRRALLAGVISINLILTSLFTSAQQIRAQQTRPRRVNKKSAVESIAPTTKAPEIKEFSMPELSPSQTNRVEAGTMPEIRIGLTTSARTASISTLQRSGELLATIGLNPTPETLSTSDVRVEPRNYTPTINIEPVTLYLVKLLSEFESREVAERAAREIETITEIKSTLTNEKDIWQVSIGSPLQSRTEAEELAQRIEEAGFSAGVIPQPQAGRDNKSDEAKKGSKVQLVVRTGIVTRGLVIYAAPASVPLSASHSKTRKTPFIEASAPVTFASRDAQNNPVRFNGRSYRGRIELFTNANGALTVINVVNLEDYVRGVVPNELSSSNESGLEAMKAQAIAARTYALKNIGQFAAQGFDLLPTTRSQVYTGLASEQPFASRAVDETRGIIATYENEPILALYTSTSGGRTEDVENIFGGEPLPYLRGRESMIPANMIDASAQIIRTNRELSQTSDGEDTEVIRALDLLQAHGLKIGGRPAGATATWLSQTVTSDDVTKVLRLVEQLSKHPPQNSDITRTTSAIENSRIKPNGDILRAPGFCSALAVALDGESRADALLNDADVNYFLIMEDEKEIPKANRADVAWFVRDGSLSLFPDGTLRPHLSLTRARMIKFVARALESHNLFALAKATLQSSRDGKISIRFGERGKNSSFELARDLFIYKVLGNSFYPAKSVAVIGGEEIRYHVNQNGKIDYLEIKPAVKGAAADRNSPYSFWSQRLTIEQLASHLGRSAEIGRLLDIRVAARGYSRRVIDLELIGTKGTTHIYGGRIRSALALREQLFVIDRQYDAGGNIKSLLFTGRGWGHGVGMCQMGASAMSRAGMRYDQILKAYYTGIELTKLY